MKARQTTYLPTRWLIISKRNADRAVGEIGALPESVGVLWCSEVDLAGHRLSGPRRVELREAAGEFARVHNSRELTSALARAVSVILISPIRATRSHPGHRPLPLMRAATLARLARPGTMVLALGGMNGRAFRRVEALGFDGWAGIDAFGS